MKSILKLKAVLRQHVILMLCLFTLVLSISSAADFTTSAKQALILDYTNNIVLFEHNADEIMHPSSMSKLMTLYLMFSKLKAGIVKMDDVYRVSKNAWEKRGSTMFLKEGQKVKVEDLLKGIAILSGNDASVVVAEGSMGSEEAFVEEMNQTAKSMGLSNSSFVNTTGLTAQNHYMSARDVVKLAVKIYEDFPEYYYLFSEKGLMFNNIKQNNTNEMLSLYHQRDLKFDGIKTGSTDAGGFGVVVSFLADGRRFFILVNGLKSKRDRSTEVQKLARYSLANFKSKRIFSKGEHIAILNVLYSSKRVLPITVPKDVYAVYGKSEEGITVTLKYRDCVPAPVRKGEIVGELILTTPFVEKIFPLAVDEGAGKLFSPLYLIFRFLF
ncbi:D-alanyl-D-alanine carboxypeptidase family protein [Neorickettsia helminthoeca]|nr:D-alanyl-D-alanine carboxypeptidase family protein [Neorickettsia helminthoeca]